MNNKIIKKEIIIQVGDIKIGDRIGDDEVVGFSQNGEDVYTREYGEEGSCIPYCEAIEMMR